MSIHNNNYLVKYVLTKFDSCGILICEDADRFCVGILSPGWGGAIRRAAPANKTNKE
jgi:hypothetical protein